MATENLQIPDIAASQNQKEVTANAAHNLLDRALNQKAAQKTISGDTQFTTLETRENIVVELIGTPGAPHVIDMPDTNERFMIVVNNTDDVMTIRNSAGGGSGQPVLAVGQAAIFQYNGTNFFDFMALFLIATPGYIPLSLGSLRLLATDEIAGLLDNTTTPSFERINGATDKGLRVLWGLSNNDEIAFPEIYMPPDIDTDKDITIHIVGEMSGASDTPTIDVLVFDSSGDTEMGGVTATFTDTRAEKTVTISAADITGHPLGWLSISLIPVGAHATDTLAIFSAWIEYTRKVA
jgi:hypothetical protein